MKIWDSVYICYKLPSRLLRAASITASTPVLVTCGLSYGFCYFILTARLSQLPLYINSLHHGMYYKQLLGCPAFCCLNSNNFLSKIWTINTPYTMGFDKPVAEGANLLNENYHMLQPPKPPLFYLLNMWASFGMFHFILYAISENSEILKRPN